MAKKRTPVPADSYSELLSGIGSVLDQARHGRGFSKSNLFLMRAFYLGWEIFQTPSGKLQARVRPVELTLPAAPDTRPVSATLAPAGFVNVVPDDVFPLS
jgi:hypothetical protein